MTVSTQNPPKAPINKARLTAYVCRNTFREFCKEFWEEVPGAGTPIWNWHMDLLCDEMQECAERVFRNEPKKYDVVVNISPGSSKSTICSILFPAWVWTRMPCARILTASHTDELVLDLSNKSRAVIKSDKYQMCYPEIQIRDDQDTKGYYANTEGGDRKTCTVGGKSPMGFHAAFIIVDDPIDPKKAVSEVELRAAKFFYDSVITTRKTNKRVTVEFTIMQRLHVQDPTGHLLERMKRDDTTPIRHICLPAVLPLGSDGAYETGNVSPPELAKRYIDGMMDPNRLPSSVIRTERATMGEYSFSAQYLQSPIPLTGGMFKEHYFQTLVPAAPHDARRIRFWDRAATEGGGCYTAGVLMAIDRQGIIYIEHVVRNQWEPLERNNMMAACARMDRLRYGPKNEPLIYVEAEGGSSGRDAWLGVVRALSGFNVKEDRPTGKKEVRAEPFAAQCAAGLVKVVDDKTWDIPSYVQELCLFPMGTYSDQTDASSGAFNLLVGQKRTFGLRTIRFGGQKQKGLRIVVCNPDELSMLSIEQNHRCLIIHFTDPECPDEYIHVIPTVVGSHKLQTLDASPVDYQEMWNLPVEPYNQTPEKLLMTREQGKAFWAFLLKKREPPADVYVFCDEGGRGESAAQAVCEVFGLQKNVAIFRPSEHDNTVKTNIDIPCRHVYDMVKATRSMVV